MNVDRSETYISLFSGGAGLDMGFQRVRPEAVCVAFVEHEASAAALLVDHVEAQLVDAAPVHTDAYTFPAGKFRGSVDWIIGGPPCQPFSVAGKQLGADDPRNLWPLTLRLVADIQPAGCFFENVPSADSLWYIYENVIPGLRHLGYEVKAGIFSAAEVGAPHNRERIFILAHSVSGRSRGGRSVHQRWATDERRRKSIRQERQVSTTNSEPYSGDVANPRQLPRQIPQAGEPDRTQRIFILADSHHQQRELQQRSARTKLDTSSGHVAVSGSHGERGQWLSEQRTHETQGRSGELGDTDGSERWPQSDEEQPSKQPYQAISQFPPGPTDDWSNVPERLWPAVKPGFRGMADGFPGTLDGLSRSQKLRILGNAVVASTAAKAFNTLYEQVMA